MIAADYGVPTTRKRWFAIFRCDDKPIIWPEPTHSKLGNDGLKKWIPVSDVLDFTDLGSSIFDRKKPLAEKTQIRIANGIKKFIINNPNPFIVPEKEAMAFLIQYHSETRNGDVRGQSLDEPIQTIDTSNRYALVTAFITKFYKTGTGQGCDEPLHTITTSPGHFGLVSAFLIKYYGSEKDGQSVDFPLGTIVTKDRFGLLSVVFTIAGQKYIIGDIFLRMLKPEESKLAQGFPKDYIIDHYSDCKAGYIKAIDDFMDKIREQKTVSACENDKYLIGVFNGLQQALQIAENMRTEQFESRWSMKKYPILGTSEYIPFEMMLEHEEQCHANHNQSVQRLAERGGTDYLETYYILNDSKFIKPDDKKVSRYAENARRIVHALAYEWLIKNNQLN